MSLNATDQTYQRGRKRKKKTRIVGNSDRTRLQIHLEHQTHNCQQDNSAKNARIHQSVGGGGVAEKKNKVSLFIPAPTNKAKRAQALSCICHFITCSTKNWIRSWCHRDFPCIMPRPPVTAKCLTWSVCSVKVCRHFLLLMSHNLTEWSLELRTWRGAIPWWTFSWVSVINYFRVR